MGRIFFSSENSWIKLSWQGFPILPVLKIESAREYSASVGPVVWNPRGTVFASKNFTRTKQLHCQGFRKRTKFPPVHWVFTMGWNHFWKTVLDLDYCNLVFLKYFFNFVTYETCIGQNSNRKKRKAVTYLNFFGSNSGWIRTDIRIL